MAVCGNRIKVGRHRHRATAAAPTSPGGPSTPGRSGP
jgi:hypothetical protein